jgi:hypothetical protein
MQFIVVREVRMKRLLAVVCLTTGVLLGPAAHAAQKSNVDKDMQRAIAWERYKDLAAARQARKEARHPSVTYSNTEANRETDETTPGRKVIDSGPPDYRKK